MSGTGRFPKLESLVRPKPRPEGERCDLCSATLAAGHEHLVAPASGKLVCSCPACALLFPVRKDARYKRVPRRVVLLPDFGKSDDLWAGLGVPVGLAFFISNSVAQRVIATYPSPAGPTPAAVDVEAWQRLCERWPVAGRMEPDVEALLIRWIDGVREAFVVPVDAAYELVGRLRLKWQGISGGDAVREEIRTFFLELRSRAVPCLEGAPCA